MKQPGKDTDLTRRSVTSVTWNSVGNLLQIIVLLVRSILLARWLPLVVFDVYPLANSIIALTVVVANFGLDGAFLHRSPQSEDEEQTAAIHFTLNLIFGLVWAALVILGALIFATGMLRLALIVLTITTIVKRQTRTPRLILTRRVVHRRLALFNFLNALMTTVVGLGLAWLGYGLWALLATDITTVALSIGLFFVYRPVWRPRLAWVPEAIRYFLAFGRRGVWADVLMQSLDRLDDIWTGFALGESAMAFYSRAYTFATYPRTILAAPINLVAGGTYAELKKDRLRLSKAFFRTNAFLIRSGFLLAGTLALLAPEFIRLALGARWLPMLDAFRLMLIFTLLDPLKTTVADLFIAVGRPELIVRARLVQLAVMVVGLVTLGPLWGITGVAIAVDLMVLIGIGLLLWQARAYVQFSTRQLFLVPLFALGMGMALALLAIRLPVVPHSPWYTGAVKIAVFLPVYGLLVFLLERRQTLKMVSILWRALPVSRRRLPWGKQ